MKWIINILLYMLHGTLQAVSLFMMAAFSYKIMMNDAEVNGILYAVEFEYDVSRYIIILLVLLSLLVLLFIGNWLEGVRGRFMQKNHMGVEFTKKRKIMFGRVFFYGGLVLLFAGLAKYIIRPSDFIVTFIGIGLASVPPILTGLYLLSNGNSDKN